MTGVFMKTTFIACSCFVIACSSNHPLDPGAGSDPGGGTQTLLVTGDAHATPRITNATSDADFDTDFSVDVSLAGATVSTGTVTVTSSSGSISLVFQTDQAGSSWRGTASGYDEVYQLDVTSGPDTVTGVRVDGPDIHSFTAPLPGANIDTTMPLTVTWDRAAEAHSATLRTDGDNGGSGELAIPDSGSYDMAANFLRADPQAVRTDMLRLVRENEVTPAGAAAGSLVTVTIENDVEVVALANPLSH
jgi:hypothetical protein